jgi:hypothetical protein
MKTKIFSSIAMLSIGMLAITTPSFFIYAKAAESEAPEPGDCPDPTDPLCPPATATNQTGNATASSSSSPSPPPTK